MTTETNVHKTVYGTFDGQNMKDDEGKTYPISPNYVSKSRLIEGDKLKLLIMENGSFVFKQIGPVPRIKAIGTFYIGREDSYISVGDRKYYVNPASVTFYHLQPGDEVSVILPDYSEAKFAAIDNKISGTNQDQEL